MKWNNHWLNIRFINLNNKSKEAKFVGDKILFKAFYASNNLCLTSLVTSILSSLLNLTIFSAVKFKSLQQGQWHCLKHLNISMSQARRPGQWHWIVKPWSKSKPLSQQTPKLNKSPPKKEERRIWTKGWHKNHMDQPPHQPPNPLTFKHEGVLK